MEQNAPHRVRHAPAIRGLLDQLETSEQAQGSRDGVWTIAGSLAHCSGAQSTTGEKQDEQAGERRAFERANQ